MNDHEHHVPTMSGLTEWYTHMFSKYGWMCLTNSQLQKKDTTFNEKEILYMKLKLQSYLVSTEMLLTKLNQKHQLSIIHAIKYETEELKLMINNVKELYKMAQALCNDSIISKTELHGGGKKISKKTSKKIKNIKKN